MLTIYFNRDGHLISEAQNLDRALPEGVVWFDLFSPSQAELAFVEQRAGLKISDQATRSEVASYLDATASQLTMTAVVISEAETDHPVSRALTFLLGGGVLVTVRTTKPKPFANFAQSAEKVAHRYTDGTAVFAGLMGAIVSRSSDVMERLAFEMEEASNEVFGLSKGAKPLNTKDFRKYLKFLGTNNDIAATIQESLFSLERVLSFPVHLQADDLAEPVLNGLTALNKEVQILRDQTKFLSNKLEFLLNVVLGLIDVEQNNIIRSLTMLATIFIPPTLIASIYGMNFDHMPELGWTLGYSLALGAMALVGLLPLIIFKARGWL